MQLFILQSTILCKCARLITGSTRRERITPILIELHWLPIKARIEFKLCMLTFLALKTNEPGYLRKKCTNMSFLLYKRAMHYIHIDWRNLLQKVVSDGGPSHTLHPDSTTNYQTISRTVKPLKFLKRN